MYLITLHTAITSLTSLLSPSSFPLGRTVNLNNNQGTITNLGAGSLPGFGVGSPIGINQLYPSSLLHFQAISTTNSTITLNIDLSQTGFTDGTFASDSLNQSQFNQLVQINSSSPTSIPEPSDVFRLVLISIFGLFVSISRLFR